MGLRRRPADARQLRCDNCGQPAAWRSRVVSACCLLGEALCDRCENRGQHAQWWAQDDSFWRELAADASWLLRELKSLPHKVRIFGRQEGPQLKPDIGWTNKATTDEPP
jgi:hypothetical protein